MFSGLKNRILMLTTPVKCSSMQIPYCAVPLLKGQLKRAGFDVISYDYSADFFKDISSLEFLKKTYKKIKTIEKKYNKKDDPKIKRAYWLYRCLYNAIKKKKPLKDSQKVLLFAFVYFPYDYLAFNNYISQGKQFSCDINDYCFNEDVNFYISYLEDKIKKLPNDVDLICISKFPDYDLSGIFTLARLLKEKYKNKKILLGGYWFYWISQELKNRPEIFDKFCDYIIIGEGENAIVELARALKGELDISKVSNLMYKNKNNEIIQNPEYSKVDINKTAWADYSDCNFENYESKTPRISMMLSKGCYWGKCKFCTYSNKNFQIKTIENAIKEIKFYYDKYKVEHILFNDDAISPKYYANLADELIKNNIKITFNSYAMFDEGFNYEIFKKCKDAGLATLTWGLETNSRKVFDYVSKSGCFEKRAQILKDAYKAGINNVVNVIEGLPSETHRDLLETVKFLYDNSEYIDRVSFQVFQMRVGSEFANNPQKYGLEIIGRNEFSLYYHFNYTNRDVNEYNSFMSYLKSVKEAVFYESELVKSVSYDYLMRFAPELLR